MLCGALSLLAAGTGLKAQETGLSPEMLKKMTVEELLNQDVVSVSRKPERWGQAAGNVFLIRGAGAVRTGAATVPQILRLAPSLFVAQTSASNWAINARGFVRSTGQSNKLLVLVDGRSVYSPLFSNVFWDAQDVFVPDLDRVEVISGPAGSTWGANAVNGVINILSKSAHETLGGVFYAESGTETKAHFGARYGGTFGRTGALRVYAQHAEHDATLNAFGAEDGRDAWSSSQTGFRADWGVAGQSAWTFQGDAFRGRADNGGALKTANDGANALLRLTRYLTPDSQLTARIYHDYTRRNDRDIIEDRLHTTDFELQHRINFEGGQELLWGGSYRSMDERIDHTVGYVILPPSLRFGLASLFFQHQIGVFDDVVRVTTGLRLEHNDFTGWEYQPNVRASWNVNDRHLVWASASRATRTPSRLDRDFYAPAEPPYIFAAGGPDVAAEVVHAYELGWRMRFAQNFSATVTVYYQDYDHLLTTELTSPIVLASKGAGRSAGVEAFVDWQATARWRMRFGMFGVDQDTRLKSGSLDSAKGYAESSFPTHQIQLRNSFQLTKKLALWTSLRSVGKVPMLDAGGQPVPAYTELDARLAWDLRPGVEVALLGRNLLDGSHPEMGTDAARREIARSVQVSLQWAF